MQIFIRSFHGPIYLFQISSNESIDTIKQRIRTMFMNIGIDIPIQMMNLTKKGKIVKSFKNNTIYDINLVKKGGMPVTVAGSLVTIDPTAPPMVTIQAQKLGAQIADNSADATQAVALNTKDSAERQLSAKERMVKWLKDNGFMGSNKSEWNAKNAKERQEELTRRAEARQMFYYRVSDTAAKYAKFMATIAKFFPIIKVMMIIIMVFTNSFKFILMFFAYIAVVILSLIYQFLSFPGVNYIPMGIYWLIWHFLPFVIQSVVIIVMFLVSFLFCLIIAIINGMTKGSLKKLLQCENSPISWYTTRNHHNVNKFTKGAIFCSRPCARGYSPDLTGMFCLRNDRRAPDFCPQAMIMRFYTGNKSERKYAYKDIQPYSNVKYRMATPEDREKMIKNNFLKRKKFLDTCKDSMTKYDYITRNICTNIDVIEKDIEDDTKIYNIKKSDLNRLKQVCSQAYCSAKETYPFCSVIADSQSEDDENLFQLIIKFLISLVVFTIIVVTLYEIIKDL